MRSKTLMVGGLALALLGCQTLNAENDRPARITSPTEASRRALQEVVDNALHTSVRLADDALTKSSVLAIEHTPLVSPQDPSPDGRETNMPIQFRLVINASNCILIDRRDDARYALENTTCVAE